ncbi:mycofactocin precursor MftA [Streptomyces sp. NBC_00582]|nr:mycofactocin precursor MftA [Streptomyces sp. NBC_00582]WUB59221.1 mycofactocin precursor MftA [Streptomyces sp. NBC_00582]
MDGNQDPTQRPIPAQTVGEADEELHLEEVLLTEISIDGMCGVY